MTVGGDRQWQQWLHQTRGAVDGGDQKQPGYRTMSYWATAVAVPGATAGRKVVAALGAKALGAEVLGVVALGTAALWGSGTWGSNACGSGVGYLELWGGGGQWHMGVIFTTSHTVSNKFCLLCVHLMFL